MSIYCSSEFHASCEAIIRQLPKVTVAIKDIGKTEQLIRDVARSVWCVARRIANGDAYKEHVKFATKSNDQIRAVLNRNVFE